MATDERYELASREIFLLTCLNWWDVCQLVRTPGGTLLLAPVSFFCSIFFFNFVLNFIFKFLVWIGETGRAVCQPLGGLFFSPKCHCLLLFLFKLFFFNFLVWSGETVRDVYQQVRTPGGTLLFHPSCDICQNTSKRKKEKRRRKIGETGGGVCQPVGTPGGSLFLTPNVIFVTSNFISVKVFWLTFTANKHFKMKMVYSSSSMI